MKTQVFITLFFFLPIFIFAQKESSEKITCEKLLSDHLGSCERCIAGEECNTRKDLIKFCSSKEQELMVVDPGPRGCGCPTYGYYYQPSNRYYRNYYQPYYGGYYYNGPTYRYGYGLSLSVGVSGGYYVRGSYGTRGSYYGNGNYYSRGGYYNNGHYHNNGSYYHHGGNYNHGGHHGNGNYNQNGNHHSNGSNNSHGGHYGSRPQSHRGG